MISEKKESLVVAISKAKRFVDDLTALEKSTQEAMNLQCRFLEVYFLLIINWSHYHFGISSDSAIVQLSHLRISLFEDIIQRPH